VAVAVEEEGGRKSRTLLYAAIAALIVVAVLTFFFLNQRKDGAQAVPPPAGAASTGAPAEPLPAADPLAGAAGAVDAAGNPVVPPGAAGTAAASGTMPADLQAMVDKQLAAKEDEMRRKNEEKLQELEKQVAAAKVSGQPVPAPPVQQAPAETPAQAPPSRPAVADPAPPPAPEPEPQREPEPVKAQEKPPAPEPAPAAAAPRTKPGELVQGGAGVVPPQLVSFPKPEYPPMARNLRVEGTVVVSVLVDENGQVQDAKVAEAIKQKVGLNEAAVASARAARYRPATRDGVRVKMWTHLRVPFKL
jgi:TonB family protein